MKSFSNDACKGQRCGGHNNHGHNHHHHHHHHHGGARAFAAPALSLFMLVAGLSITHFGCDFFHAEAPKLSPVLKYLWYVAAFLPVGLPVVKEAAEGILHGDFFNEFTLMTLACVGAFCIGELPEAVGVMLFYSIGETLQHGAVDRATRNISRLLDVRGERATVLRDGEEATVNPRSVKPDEVIVVHPGERVPLDGVITGADGVFDTSALTGESVPREISGGDEVLAGMICLRRSVRLRVSREFGESALSRILAMVGEASSRKAHAELFIRRFARIYTPVVIALALLVVAVPALVAAVRPDFHYVFSEWLYKALVFLVISCPCALVVSVPLGYFAGIGAASRLGILFKGGNYLEAVRRIDTVAFDKTGTLTTGRFGVGRVECVDGDELPMLCLMAAAESGSSHPLAKTLVEYVSSRGGRIPKAEDMSEMAGFGVKAHVDGHEVLVGNPRLLESEGVPFPAGAGAGAGTVIACAVDGRYRGCVLLADTVKPDAADALAQLRGLGVRRLLMLSGDRREITDAYAARLGIDEAHGELLPQDKARIVERLTKTPGNVTAFVGDGMNDAPVLALSDVGIAMGGLGSDAAIESADVVIQTDKPSRIATAIRIGRETHTVVMENIVGAIGIKVAILVLGVLGYASLWGAVFADVGVALLAVLNSMRILWKRYR